MKFADFVSREAVRADLTADDKESVIREMTQALLDAGKIAPSEYEGIIRAILKREELGSTGIGRGVAVPHTKHASVDRLTGTVGVSAEGVDFDSLDGEKGEPVLLVDLAAGSPRRSLASLGKRLPPIARRDLLQVLETSEERGGDSATIGRGR